MPCTFIDAFRGPFCLLPPSLLKTLLKASHPSNSGSHTSRCEVILWILLKILLLFDVTLCHWANTSRYFEESERLSLLESLTLNYGIARSERDGTRTETSFRLSPKRTSPFKSVGGVSSVDCWQTRCAHQLE